MLSFWVCLNALLANFACQIIFIICNDTKMMLIFYSPAGWDNEKKISILFENLHNMKPDDAYEDKIAKPKVGKVCQSVISELSRKYCCLCY